MIENIKKSFFRVYQFVTKKFNEDYRELDNKQYFKEIICVLYLPFSILYMEILAKLSLFGTVFDKMFGYLLFFSMSMGFLLSGVAMVISGKGRRKFYYIVLSVLTVWFSFHVSYYGNFHTFFSWQNIGQAKDVTQFWREAIVAALNMWNVILGFFVPLIIMGAIGILIIPDKSKRSLSWFLISVASFGLLFFPARIIMVVTNNHKDDFTPYYYYTYLQNDLDMSFKYYGIITVTRLDLNQLIFGAPVEEIALDDEDYLQKTDVNQKPDNVVSDSDKKTEYGYNVMDIDFEKAANATRSEVLKTMDKYFSNVPPTQQNEYTGIFKGKNLIFITIEGFSDKMIDPEFTPILYKMSTQGFVFKNFYNTVWGGSTASGEYAALTGNFYLNSSCLQKSGSTYQPFTLGNQLSSIGYKTLGYHNNSYTYYSRHLSHPNFGYQWTGIGNGLQLKSDCWPRSDKEMAEATVDEYSGLDVPFHVYYMTVSGHANYSYAGNMMSVWHKSDLTEAHQKYSSDVKAYLACEYEFELMLGVLMDRLEKAGKLQDTVFAMVADHYPYALSDEGLSELYGLPQAGIRNNFDLYRNSYILWTPSMTEPVEVDKYCSAIDVTPTLLNMFGLQYDSRLMMGSDIMAPGEHYALLKVSGWSWLSEKGSYRATSQKFIPSSDCTLSEKDKEKYVARINKEIRAKITYSKQMLDNDYYAHVFRKKK